MGRFAFRGFAFALLVFSLAFIFPRLAAADVDTEAMVAALAATTSPHSVQRIVDQSFRRAGYSGRPRILLVRDELEKLNSAQWLRIAAQPKVLDKVICLLGLDRALGVQRELLEAFPVPRSPEQSALLAAFSRVMTERCLANGGVSHNPILLPFLATTATALLTSFYWIGGVAAGADFPSVAVTSLSVLAGAIAGVADWATQRGFREANGARLTAVLGQTAAFNEPLSLALAQAVRQTPLPKDCLQFVVGLGRQNLNDGAVF